MTRALLIFALLCAADCSRDAWSRDYDAAVDELLEQWSLGE